ncbi:DNA-binding transcriptional regulator, ArsR family [Marinospirillum celere]|uniref:DNA-binding transcriptional regulator, ArsR family n=1 Tax=Marinospirillum celere TaxID=1122252 RepID=A0A1I1H324_9GAMM|nr:metalloregulator ArsR/SmtB family transcription factor [Marinospirillum celere]SFC18324.1 DNA-binding transcriptional regulator, ArsR family [Marinospirillum celere]
MNLEKMRSQAKEASCFLQACAHQSRLMLLCQLIQEEMNVGQLEERLGIQQPSLSQQLGVLRRQGLISGRRSGQQVYYRVSDSRAKSLVENLYQIFCEEKVNNG